MTTEERTYYVVVVTPTHPGSSPQVYGPFLLRSAAVHWATNQLAQIAGRNLASVEWHVLPVRSPTRLGAR